MLRAPSGWLAIAWLVGLCACDDDPPKREARDAGNDSGHERPTDPELELTEWRPLFDATLSEWYTFLPSHGRDADPDGVFRMEDGDVLHILGNTPPPGDQEFGYVSTRADFANYRFKLEQRWGQQKFAPRANDVRDSGLLYHTRGGDEVWPHSVEFQIQENDIGDLFLLGPIGITTLVDPENENMFKESGQTRMLRRGVIKKGATYESLTEWNDLELVASEREFLHAVNGKVNQRGWALEYEQDGVWSPLDRGRIVLQAEGAEVFYRNALIRPLRYPPPPAGAEVVFDGTSLAGFQHPDGSEPRWNLVDGALEIAPGTGDLVTHELPDAIRLHFEFRLPATPDPELPEQERAHSRVLLAQRYAVQLRDSYGRALSDQTSGAVLGEPATNAALPAEVWQSVDIVFRERDWDAHGDRGPARITIVYNGSLLYRQLEIHASSTDGPGGDGGVPAKLWIADEGSRVRFRNIWFQRL